MGPVSQVAVAASHEHPSDGLCLIAGEPYHRVISARRWVSPQCNDAVNFIYDHTDMLTRLSAERRPPSARSDPSAAPPILGTIGRRLLLKAVELSASEFVAMRRTRGMQSLRAFLSSKNVMRAQLFNRGSSVQLCLFGRVLCSHDARQQFATHAPSGPTQRWCSGCHSRWRPRREGTAEPGQQRCIPPRSASHLPKQTKGALQNLL